MTFICYKDIQIQLYKSGGKSLTNLQQMKKVEVTNILIANIQKIKTKKKFSNIYALKSDLLAILTIESFIFRKQ